VLAYHFVSVGWAEHPYQALRTNYAAQRACG